MKRTLLLLCFTALFTTGLVAQPNLIYSEDFSSGMPAEYNLVNKDGKTASPNLSWFPAGAAWAVVPGSFAGEAAVSISWYTVPAASDDWMITGGIAIPTKMSNDNKILLTWYARAQDPQYPDGYEVYISTTGNKPEDFTTKLFSVAAENSAGITRAVDLSSYANQTVYLAYRNNSFDMFVLVIDDIRIAEVAPNEVSAVRVTNRGYNPQGNSNLSLLVNNEGSATITSMTLEYKIDGGAPVTADVMGLNIAPLSSGTVTHPTAWAASAGSHDCEITVLKVNGVVDANPANNTAQTTVSMYDPANAVARKVLMEGFSASTCPPCAPANVTYKNLINGLAPAARPITLKYQMPFPGTGDPYTTEEITARGLDYYQTSGIPDSYIDGDFWNGLTGNITAPILANAKNRAALVSFDLKYEIDSVNQTIKIKGSMTPSADLIAGTKLMIAIKESQTFKNVGTNGETSFQEVVKKLINGTEGTEIGGVTAGSTETIDVTYTFNGKYRLPANGQPANWINHATEHSVEHFSNLKVAAWVEYQRDQYVLNAVEAELADLSSSNQEPTALTGFGVFPNPASVEAMVDLQLTEPLRARVVLFDAQGREVRQVFEGNLNAGATRLPVQVQDLAAGTYFLHLQSQAGVSIRNIEVVK